MLSEARSEMNTQELKTESANMALREFELTNAFSSYGAVPSASYILYIYIYLRTHGESRPGSKQNWRNEKELIRKLVLELSRKWKN